MKNKKKIIRINPLAHQVYEWWLKLFQNLADTIAYDNNTWVKYKFVEQKPLIPKRNIAIGRSSFFNLYKNPTNTSIPWTTIVGDILTNSLCRTINNKDTIYHTEFFLKKNDPKRKKILIYLIGKYFAKKKIIVPTVHAYNTRKKHCSKILYLPQLYHDDLYDNPTLTNPKAKILYVGKIDDRKKNISILLQTYLELKKKHKDISLALVGRKSDNSLIDRYKNELKPNDIKYREHSDRKQLKQIYLEHNIFVLPSIVDPIGAVVMEAMGHSLPIITTEYTGASSYIQHEQNWLIIKPDQQSMYKALETLILDQTKRELYGKQSKQILWDKYALQNEKIKKSYQKKLSNFISI